MEQYELIKKLKPLVTDFSEGVRLLRKHGDEVRIGGKVVGVYDMDKLMGVEEPHMVQVNVDDSVGEITLLIPDKLLDELHVDIGEEILAIGKVFDPDNDMKAKRHNARVACWTIESLSPANSEEEE